MPLFEIANAQHTFLYPLCSLRAQIPYHGKFLTFGYVGGVPWAWKSLDKLKRMNFNVGGVVEFRRCRLMIKAVAATFEPKRLAAKEKECFSSKGLEMCLNPNPQPGFRLEFSNDGSEEIEEKEKLRRMRISKANKGITPWNKGRKHSAETLQKIKERTRLAMQNPKVKMKLANFGHAQTTETRLKIGAGVKMKWEKKRERKVVQETCFLQWQNLIAEASRQGYAGQEGLQWTSYETLKEQLQLEWLDAVEERKVKKQMPREPGSKRAPKTLEQRRKIAEAIAEKWADPDYRNRVCSAMAKYHGNEGDANKPKRRPSDGARSTWRNRTMKKDTDANIYVKCGTRIPNQIQVKKSKSPPYIDPLVSFKLDMIKSIRAQRASAETKHDKAFEHARLLIAEAEKAAQALEIAATKSPIAQASLIETRKLISEAIQTLESIDPQGTTLNNVPSAALSETNKEKDADFDVLNQPHVVPVNGHKSLPSSDKFSEGFGEFSLHKLVNGNSGIHLTRTSNGFASSSSIVESSSSNQQSETEEVQGSGECKADPSPTLLGVESIKDEAHAKSDEAQAKSPIVTKKWVRGRLVEVV